MNFIGGRRRTPPMCVSPLASLATAQILPPPAESLDHAIPSTSSESWHGMSAAMAAMVTDTLLTTAPAATFPLLRRPPHGIPSSRLPLQTPFRPRATLRVSCCTTTNDAATTTTTPTTPSTADRIESDACSSSSSERGIGEVYVASVPVRAPNGAAQLLDAVKDLDNFADVQHYMTIIKPYDQEPCTVLDFQPQNPEDLMTAVAVLMGKSIPGVILVRSLSRLPNQRCWLVGAMKPGLSLEDAVAFHRGYNSELSLGINDCRHHTLDLVEYLTGKSMTLIEEVRQKPEEDEPEDELEENSSEEFPDLLSQLRHLWKL